MRPLFAAALALTATTGAALAQEGQGTYKPLSETVVQVSGQDETVRRDAARSAHKGFRGLHLPKASVADVDLNGDGYPEVVYNGTRSPNYAPAPHRSLPPG